MWSVLNVDADLLIKSQIADFNQQHQDVQIDLTFTGSPDAIFAKLAAGERPDLLLMGIEAMVNLSDGGLITDAAACVANDPTFDAPDFVPVTLATYQLRGRQVGIPLSVSTPVMFYDRTQFARHGLDPDHPPQTLAELRSTLEALMGSGDFGDGLGYGDASWFVSQWAAQLGEEIVSDGNGHDVAPGVGPSLQLGRPRLLMALGELQSMAAAGLISKPIKNNTGYDDLLHLIDPAQPGAMALHTSGATSRVYELLAGLTKSTAVVGVGPMPGPGSGALVGGSAMWITTSDVARVWPVWTAVRYFSDTRQQAQFGALGYAPSRKSSVDDAALRSVWTRFPGLRVGYDQLADVSATPAHLRIAIGPEPVLSWRLNWAGEDVVDVARQQTPNAALANAERDASASMRAYAELRYGAS